jgi:hypothetical protein
MFGLSYGLTLIANDFQETDSGDRSDGKSCGYSCDSAQQHDSPYHQLSSGIVAPTKTIAIAAAQPIALEGIHTNACLV